MEILVLEPLAARENTAESGCRPLSGLGGAAEGGDSVGCA